MENLRILPADFNRMTKVQPPPESPLELHRTISQQTGILAWLSEQLLGALQEDDVDSGVEMIFGDENAPLGEAVQAKLCRRSPRCCRTRKFPRRSYSALPNRLQRFRIDLCWISPSDFSVSGLLGFVGLEMFVQQVAILGEKM